MKRFPIRTRLNSAFKIAQPLPRIPFVADFSSIRKLEGPAPHPGFDGIPPELLILARTAPIWTGNSVYQENGQA
jgi:hypothetical protein